MLKATDPISNNESVQFKDRGDRSELQLVLDFIAVNPLEVGFTVLWKIWKTVFVIHQTCLFTSYFSDAGK